jgi:hypothetical protein
VIRNKAEEQQHKNKKRNTEQQPDVVSKLVEAYTRRERLVGCSWLTMHFV